MTNLNPEKPKRMFDALTGVRAIAAFLVFFHHNNMFPANKYGTFVHDFVNEFHIGVTIFFVLSGFLICYRYYDNTDLRSHRWLLTYIRNRVARIYPMYFLITTITFIPIFIHSQQLSGDIGVYLANISFLRGFFKDLAFTGVSQGWSLTVEECFYFSAPFLFLATRRKYPFFYFLLIPLLGVALVLLSRYISCYGFFGSFKFMFSYTYFGRCFEFFAGMALARYYARNKGRKTTGPKLWTLAGIAWICICLGLLVEVRGDMRFGVYTAPGIFINNLVLPLGIAMLFWGLIMEDTPVKRLLSTRLFVLLGKSSYTFYLVHQGVIAWWLYERVPHTLLAFVLLNVLSVLLFQYVEEPCNRAIRKIRLYADRSK